MKKIVAVAILGLLLGIVIAGFARADEPEVIQPQISVGDLVSKLKFESGIAYSSKEHKWINTETIKIIDYASTDKVNKDTVIYKLNPALNAGYATNDKLIVSASCSLFKMSDYVKIPILDLLKIDPMASYCFGRINLKDLKDTENQWILGAKAIEWKF